MDYKLATITGNVYIIVLAFPPGFLPFTQIVGSRIKLEIPKSLVMAM